MRVAPLLCSVLLVGACVAPVDVVPTAQERSEAERFVATTLSGQFPTYPKADAAAACIQQNATGQEVRLLAGQAGAGKPSARQRLGVVIAQRPETQACFQAGNLPRLR